MTVKNVKGQKRVWKFKYEQNKQEAEAVMACHSGDFQEHEVGSRLVLELRTRMRMRPADGVLAAGYLCGMAR